MSTKGLFIVIDGADGSGKATQTKLLAENLQKLGKSVFTIDFPQYTNNLCGGLIRECLDGKRGDFMALDPRIASVLYAADRFETKTKIEDALNKGMIVIADRYVSANQIHQGSKINDPVEKVAFMNWLEDLEYGVFGIPRPDIILYLSVSLNKSMDLMYKRIESKERDVSVSHDVSDTDVSHQHNSRMNALELVEATNNWIKIDCMDGDDILPIEAIQDKIQTALKPHLEL